MTQVDQSLPTPVREVMQSYLNFWMWSNSSAGQTNKLCSECIWSVHPPYSPSPWDGGLCVLGRMASTPGWTLRHRLPFSVSTVIAAVINFQPWSQGRRSIGHFVTSLMGKKTVQGQSYRKSNCDGSQRWTHCVPNILKTCLFLVLFLLFSLHSFFFHFFLLSY